MYGTSVFGRLRDPSNSEITEHNVSSRDVFGDLFGSNEGEFYESSMFGKVLKNRQKARHTGQLVY